MPLHFDFVERPRLPKLAWCVRLSEGSERVEVLHGPWVETSPRGFVEGAWQGPFEAGELDRSPLLLGSGGRLVDGALVVASATHTLERLHSLRSGQHLAVSNSLAFLLAATGEECDLQYPFYDLDLLSFVEGASGARRSIPTRSNLRIRLHYCTNLVIDARLQVRELEKPQFDGGFESFAEYRAFLLRVGGSLTDNAAAEARTIKYRSLATVSSGYDSPACAVLAKALGADRALTFGEARATFGEETDSGVRIGERLGLEVVEFERSAYLKRSDLPEVEFLAVGTGGEDVVMSALEPSLPRSILFTGFLGDTMWGLSGDSSRSRSYRMTYPAGASLHEFRLRVGFVHFPVPQAHQRLHPLVQAVSRSSEMEPWRRGGSYDRPIARRLAEEAGVPGEWFGRSKKAITQPFYHGEALSETLSARSLEELHRHLAAHAPGSTSGSAQTRGPLHTAWALAERASWRLRWFRPAAWRLLRRLNPASNTRTFHWAVKVLRRRYADAL